jgi:ABC-type transport system involved in cytochrome c biogenesis ATPase subunit
MSTLLQLKAGEALTVLAFAGAGKTACLRAFALARPSDK